MGTGNLTLHGWALSLDSFWTVDAVVYTLVELVTGVRGALLFLVPALIAASVVVVGVLLARDGRRGIAGVAAAATVVVVLGLPGHVLANVFLRGPLHVGTALLCLAFAGLRRVVSGGAGSLRSCAWPPAFSVISRRRCSDLLRCAQPGSFPCCASRLAIRGARGRRGGVRTGPRCGGSGGFRCRRDVFRECQPSPSLCVADGRQPPSTAVVGRQHARCRRRTARQRRCAGGAPSRAPDQPDRRDRGHRGGSRGNGQGGDSRTGVVVTGRRPDWRLDDLLVLAAFADLVIFVVLTTSDDPGFLRYLTAAVIFGAVLAGRWVGRLSRAAGGAADEEASSSLLRCRRRRRHCRRRRSLLRCLRVHPCRPDARATICPARHVPRRSSTGPRDRRLLGVPRSPPWPRAVP